MEKDIIKALEKILIPVTQGWEVKEIKVDDVLGEVHVHLHYPKNKIEIAGKEYKLYDHRSERKWRHLDLWQYKTFIYARVPRYESEEGVKTLGVPWADAHERISCMLEKKR
jgi:hypothetical protein